MDGIMKLARRTPQLRQNHEVGMLRMLTVFLTASGHLAEEVFGGRCAVLISLPVRRQPMFCHSPRAYF